MSETHESALTTALSHLRETSYGVRRLNSDGWRRIISSSRQVAADTLSFGNDEGYETGVDIPTEYWGEIAGATFPITPKFNFQDIGYMLDLCLGGYSVSGPDGGLYTHVFTPQDSSLSRQLPSRTGLKDHGAEGLELYPGLFSTAFNIVFGQRGRLDTSQSLEGNGDIEEDPAGYAVPDITDLPAREYGYASQARGIAISEAGVGTRQVTTATAAGTASTPGNASLIVTASGLTGSPITVPVALAGTENASAQAAKFRTALRANSIIRAFAEITGTGADLVATKWAKEANDVTFNIEIAAGTTGITGDPTSTATTAGVAGTSEPLGCSLETATLAFNNPLAHDGYLACSEYLDPANPMSGQLRAQALFGIRSFMLDFDVVSSGVASNLRTWRRNQTDLEVAIPVIGTEANDFSLRVSHARARVIDSTRATGMRGGFLGRRGQIALLGSAAGDGSIPLTVTLVNDIPSYAS